MSMELINGVYVADTARLLGELVMGKDANVWYGALIRGDVAAIHIGEGTNVQDNAVVHCDLGFANVIEANVTIGHGAIVHGEWIGEGSLIGMGSTLLGHTRIGRGCLVAAGAVVPPGLVVPDGMVVMGVPGRIVRETTEKERAYMAHLPPHYVKLAKRHHEHPGDVTVRRWGTGA